MARLNAKWFNFTLRGKTWDHFWQDAATTGGSGSQSLTQSSTFTNSNSFYTHSISVGAVTLTQSSTFTNSNSFYTHSIAKTIALTQSSTFTNSNTFFTHSLKGTIALTQSSIFSNNPTFFTHSIAVGAVSLTQSSSFTNSNSFYTHSLSQGGSSQSLTQDSIFTNAPTFFTHSLSASIALVQSSAFTNSNTFYTHVVDQFFTLTMTSTQAIRLEAVFRRHGLIDPLVITPTSIGDGTLTMTRAWDGTTETDTVTTLPLTGAPTVELLDKLARHYGLYDPVQVTATSRTDGTFSQTISEVGTNITVTP